MSHLHRTHTLAVSVLLSAMAVLPGLTPRPLPAAEPKEGQALPLDKLLKCTSLQSTTLQYKRAEKEYVGKTFQGIIDVDDVDEKDGKVVITGRAGPFVAAANATGGYTARPQLEIRIFVDDPRLKEKAVEISRMDRLQVTAKLQRLWKEGTNLLEAGAEFGGVKSLEVKPSPKTSDEPPKAQVLSPYYSPSP
jgi:hypothetical protein